MTFLHKIMIGLLMIKKVNVIVIENGCFKGTFLGSYEALVGLK